MDNIFNITYILIVILAITSIYFFRTSYLLKQKYSHIIEVDDEVLNLKDSILNLSAEFKLKKQQYDELSKQVALYNNQLDLIEIGFYEPLFDFDTSEIFKEQIDQVKDEQKLLIGKNRAIYAKREWLVEGSKQKGKKFSDKQIKLTSRAFNNECDSAIAQLKWNNSSILIERIRKAYDSINKLNEINEIVISEEYLDLKLKELHLTYGYINKKQQEKEAQKEIQSEMKQKLLEETRLAQEIAEFNKDEEKYKLLLAKAQKDIEKATYQNIEELTDKINELQSKLKESHEKNIKATSMAQQTKSGYIYVISNIGSFGENIYKIGMTRRIDPTERIDELSSASVPFIFDIHALIYVEDAPKIEAELHKKFADRRVNVVNNRKEFFNVNIDEIEKEVLSIYPHVEFIKIPEAKEYRESLLLKHKY